MRPLVMALAVLCTVVGSAIAKPKIAALVTGDQSDSVEGTLREVLAETGRVIEPKTVDRTRAKLGLSADLDLKDTEQLRDKLGATVLVTGKLARDGKHRSLHLRVAVRG